MGLLLVTWKKIWLIGDWRISSNDRVVSSRLLAKIIAYLVSISWLLCLVFLYGWRVLYKISLDWPLSLTTQLSTSKLSVNSEQSQKQLQDTVWVQSPSCFTFLKSI